MAKGGGGEGFGSSGGSHEGGEGHSGSGREGKSEGISPVNEGFNGKGFAKSEISTVSSGEKTANLESKLEFTEMTESYSKEALKEIVDKYGDVINERNMERINEGPNRIRVLPSKQGSRTGSYGFHNGKSEITVNALDEAQIERTTLHENLHFCSNNLEIIIPVQGKNGYNVVNTVGMRHSSYFHNVRTGENSDYSEHGRGFNEGYTTHTTNKMLAERSPEKGAEAARHQIYSNAAELVESLEEIVGKEALENYYFNGNETALKNMVELYAGKNAYSQLENCLDRSINSDITVRVQATKEAQEILAKMSEAKEEEASVAKTGGKKK